MDAQPEPTYVTAPFIREQEIQGRVFYKRGDRNAGTRQACLRNERSTALLEAFREPSTPAAVARRVALAEGDVSRLVATLVGAELLVPTEAVAVPLPSVEVEVTNRCNAVCVMCPRDALRPLGDMTPEVVDRLVSFVSSYPCPGVILQGIGEPTLYHELVPTVARLRAVLPADSPVAVVTNGLKMTGELFEDLRQAGLSYLKWSLHSLDRQRYAEIMGIDGLERSLGNLDDCLRVDGDMVAVNFVQMDANDREVDDFVSYLAERDLPQARLRLIPLTNRGGTVDVAGLRERRADQAPMTGRCLFTRKSLFVTWDGSLIPCSNDTESTVVYAHLLEDEPDVVLDRWLDDLLVRKASFEICQSCDHLSRDTLETGWFREVGDRPRPWRARSEVAS